MYGSIPQDSEFLLGTCHPRSMSIQKFYEPKTTSIRYQKANCCKEQENWLLVILNICNLSCVSIWVPLELSLWEIGKEMTNFFVVKRSEQERWQHCILPLLFFFAVFISMSAELALHFPSSSDENSESLMGERTEQQQEQDTRPTSSKRIIIGVEVLRFVLGAEPFSYRLGPRWLLQSKGDYIYQKTRSEFSKTKHFCDRKPCLSSSCHLSLFQKSSFMHTAADADVDVEEAQKAGFFRRRRWSFSAKKEGSEAYGS